MICPFCKQKINDEAKFCLKCGKKIPRCPTCNTVLTSKTKFCKIDGTILPDELIAELPEKEIVPSNESPKRFCKECGSPCAPDQLYCVNCLTKKKKIATQPKKKPKFLVALVVILLLLILAAVTIAGYKIVTTGSLFGTVSSTQDRFDDEQDNDSDIIKPQNIEDTDTETEVDSSISSEIVQPIRSEQEDSEEKHRYEVIAGDISWIDANQAAKEAGGHLATITSVDEYTQICELADKSGLKYLWLGALLSSSKMNWGDTGTWITGESWTYDNWYPGEPSKEDVDGTKEFYLCLWKAQYNEKDIGWTFNDQRNDITTDFKDCQGKVGYIIEYGDGYKS